MRVRSYLAYQASPGTGVTRPRAVNFMEDIPTYNNAKLFHKSDREHVHSPMASGSVSESMWQYKSYSTSHGID